MRRPLHSVLLLIILTLPAACARSAGVGHGTPGAVQRVQLDDAGVSALAALLRMEDSRVLDTILVSRVLADPVVEVRARAALAAGRIGDHAATPLLLRALADSEATVRGRAAFALGELGDTGTVVIDGLTRTALHDVAAAAVEAVAAIGR
ncbi:MAG: HEAT repeat domain-containing protein, partial [Gemmatimonadetes bacterium]|nr:HEAT repeat domain-containing protein [Gemmatimonadota bacterium]